MSLYTAEGIKYMGKKIISMDQISTDNEEPLLSSEEARQKLYSAIKKAKYVIVENISMTI